MTTNNAVNITSAGIVKYNGSGSFTPITVTNHAALVGAASNGITSVGPTSTAGQVFQSGGSSADPLFSTATYPATATSTGTILRADGTNWSATTATYPTTTTSQQILYSSAANTVSGLGVPSYPGSRLIFDGTNTVWFNPEIHSYFETDFEFAPTSSPWKNNNTGSGSKVTFYTNGNAAHPGVMDCETGTTTTGSSTMGLTFTGGGPVILGGGSMDWTWWVKLSALSTGTDTYFVLVGLWDNVNATATPANGVYFSYTDTGSSPNWVANITVSSSATTGATGIAASATTYQALRCTINAAGTAATFYVNNVSVATVTANVPTVNLNPAVFIIKSAGSNSRSILFDRYQHLIVLSANRNASG